MKKKQYYYRLYGRTLASDAALGNFPKVQAGRTSFSLTAGRKRFGKAAVNWYHTIRLSGERAASFGRTASGFVVRLHGSADFHISADGRSIQYRRSARISQDELNALFLSQVFPLALTLDGALVLHASAVVVGGRAYAFLGRAGSGKSTLAAAFAALGYRVLSDDAIILKFEAGRKNPLVIPSYPELRIERGVFKLLCQRKEFGRKVIPVFRKVRVPLPAASSREYELGAVFLLQRSARSARVRAEPLGAKNSWQALLENSLRLNLMNRTALSTELEQLARLGRKLSVISLRYPQGLKNLAWVTRELANLIPGVRSHKRR